MIAQILSAVGDARNVKKCSNCMTRLRLSLLDPSLVLQDELKSIAGV
ncbi:MAG: PTS transporter subunit EIIB, partial [Enterovibrio sp.]